jgi:reactive intermediate/imine deaminase
MSKSVLESSKVSRPAGIMSQGVKATGGHLIFASGQVSRNVNGETVGVGDIKAQTRQVLENLKAVLEEGGATLDDVVKVTVFVTNVAEQFAQIHEVRGEYWKDDYPASTLVEISALADPDLLIEIEALAVIP